MLMRKPHLKVVDSTIVDRTVTPRRRPNADLRTRQYLMPDEIETPFEPVKDNRYGHRDATMILVAYRHGLRAAELVNLRWSQVDWDNARLNVRRVKNGVPSAHPFKGDEMRALRRMRCERSVGLNARPKTANTCLSQSEDRHSRRPLLPSCRTR
jgi:integrase